MMKLKSILVIDDSEADQFLTKLTIEEYDKEVLIHQTFDGEEALELLNKLGQHPDLIFLDINMPRLDGFEFLEEYQKKNYKKPVVIMLTSSLNEKDKIKAETYECVKSYINKPLDINVFKDIIKNF